MSGFWSSDGWVSLEHYRYICANQQTIMKAAMKVCSFDWSGNDPDAVAAIDALRELIGTFHNPEPFKDYVVTVRKK
jgi:hypothetical protein